jgi:hypothetical protein
MFEFNTCHSTLSRLKPLVPFQPAAVGTEQLDMFCSLDQEPAILSEEGYLESLFEMAILGLCDTRCEFSQLDEAIGLGYLLVIEGLEL